MGSGYEAVLFRHDGGGVRDRHGRGGGAGGYGRGVNVGAAGGGGQPAAGRAGGWRGQLDGVVVVETDGTVFALAYANGVVYAGGVFANALPPGTPAGTTTGEVPRTFLAAFNSTTGALITSFDPTITSTSPRRRGCTR